MYHLLVNTNQDIKRRYIKDKDSTVYTTEHKVKELQQLYPMGPTTGTT